MHNGVKSSYFRKCSFVTSLQHTHENVVINVMDAIPGIRKSKFRKLKHRKGQNSEHFQEIQNHKKYNGFSF